jgi:hypothetical protein
MSLTTLLAGLDLFTHFAGRAWCLFKDKVGVNLPTLLSGLDVLLARLAAASCLLVVLVATYRA